MNADEIITVVSGWRAGRKVQCREKGWTGEWKFGSNERKPVWNFDKYDYRLAPVPVPPGDLTWEEAEALRKAGVPVQVWLPNEEVWFDPLPDTPIKNPHLAYRRTPAPRMVPLGPEDVKPGDVVRFNNEPLWKWRRIRPVSSDTCSVSGYGTRTFAEIQMNAAISRDGGLTWARAEKPEGGK